jgi:hypothetical protein
VRRLAIALVLLVLTLAVPGYARAGDSLEVVTIPKIPGARFVVQGRTFVADGRGIAHLPASAARANFKPGAPGVLVRRGVRARFAKWYGSASSGELKATYDLYYLIRPRFFDLDKNTIDPALISAATVRNSIGMRYELEAGKPTWLQGGRVVPLNGSLEPKEIYYTFERVIVAGANVVNNGQQKFFPSEVAAQRRGDEAAVAVELLFYGARFTVRDAFFGFRIGHGIRLVWPNGRVEQYQLGEDGVASIAALPRGEYQVDVEGPGLSLGGPVTLSKDQDVEVALLSYIDLAVVAFFASLALALPLARRKHLAARLRERARASAGRPATVDGREIVARVDAGQRSADAAAGNVSTLAARIKKYTSPEDRESPSGADATIASSIGTLGDRMGQQ